MCELVAWSNNGTPIFFPAVQVIVLFMMLVYSFFFNLLVSPPGGTALVSFPK